MYILLALSLAISSSNNKIYYYNKY